MSLYLKENQPKLLSQDAVVISISFCERNGRYYSSYTFLSAVDKFCSEGEMRCSGPCLEICDSQRYEKDFEASVTRKRLMHVRACGRKKRS